MKPEANDCSYSPNSNPTTRSRSRRSLFVGAILIAVVLSSCGWLDESGPFVLDLTDGIEKSNFNGNRVGETSVRFNSDDPRLLIKLKAGQEITLTGTNKGSIFTGETLDHIRVAQTGFTSDTVIDELTARSATAKIEIDLAAVTEWIEETEAIGSGAVGFPRSFNAGRRDLAETELTASVGLRAPSHNKYTIVFVVSPLE